MEASPTTRDKGSVAALAGSRMLMLQPDAVLCRLAARGNASAYDALYQRYRQPVFAFVYHLLGRRNGGEDAEDITQEAFTKAFSAIEQKRVDGSFKSWIHTIARNLTFDQIRSASHSVIPMDAQTVEMKSTKTVESASASAENRAEFAWVVAAMTELPERQREALVMREMGGMSHSEIAEALDATVPATKKLISRGRATVGDAARANGVRPRKLQKELAMAAPVLPIAAAATIGFGGAGAAGGATIGTAAVGTKVAATVLTVVAVGGSAAVVQKAEERPAKAASGETRSVADQIAGLGDEDPVVIAPVSQPQAGGSKSEARDRESARHRRESKAGRHGFRREGSHRRHHDGRDDFSDDSHRGKQGSGGDAGDRSRDRDRHDGDRDGRETRTDRDRSDWGSNSGSGSDTKPGSGDHSGRHHRDDD